MHPPQHHLRYFRKRHHLNLEDIAVLIGGKHIAQVSRHETSKIGPKLELCIIYHLLFNEPIERFFIQQKKLLRRKLLIRIPNMINDLAVLQSKDVRYKQDFLKETLKALTTQEQYDKPKQPSLFTK